ncbi:MAG: hypothetical protein M1834_000134 [Cirrosporium novae-zelandiae]|nr:MAG: hypothetical protein M1834_000134 [Cirrosporium novae-zelandiae]
MSTTTRPSSSSDLKHTTLSLPVPTVLPTSTLHLHLTYYPTHTPSSPPSLLLFITTTPLTSSPSQSSPMGSFVYAIPSSLLNTNNKTILTTPLYTVPSNIDLTNRVATALAHKLGAPVWVGCSVDFGFGGQDVGEMDVLRGVLAAVGAEEEGK